MTPNTTPQKRWWPGLPLSAADWEFTSNFISRPLAAALLYPVRGTASPNVVTLLSLFAGLAGAALLWLPGALAGALGLLFLAMVLDDGDGQLARYQGRSSRLGSFLDKSVDVVRFGLLFPILSWLAVEQSGAWIHGMAGPLAAFGLMIQGYSKWLAAAMLPAAAETPAADAAPAQDRPTGRPWISGTAVALLWPFHECDLTVWIVALGATRQWVALVWILAVSQLVAGAAALSSRLIQVWRAEPRRSG
ncbi:MAG: hypothetical protein CVU59_04855, partial [Deltaproteobacteria bacterium HGW-Deltaproteobacteria-17]